MSKNKNKIFYWKCFICTVIISVLTGKVCALESLMRFSTNRAASLVYTQHIKPFAKMRTSTSFLSYDKRTFNTTKRSFSANYSPKASFLEGYSIVPKNIIDRKIPLKLTTSFFSNSINHLLKRTYSTNSISHQPRELPQKAIKLKSNKELAFDDFPTREEIDNIPDEIIPALTMEDSLQKIYEVTNNFCYKTIRLIDTELSVQAKEAIITLKHISDREDNNGRIHMQLHRGFVDDLENSLIEWENRLKTLLKNGFIEIRNTADTSIKITDAVIKILEANKISKQQINNIPQAINNISVAFKKEYLSLYGAELYDKWPYNNLIRYKKAIEKVL